MKKLMLIATMLIGSITMAQDQYANGMKRAFTLWGENKTQEAANLFERIASVELDNWLPSYYTAQINTLISFGEKDKEKLSRQLGKAQEFIDIAKAISPDNAEILVQQAMIHTAWIVFDGATYGMELSGKNAALYSKALELAPDNPRVVFSKAEWDMGAARYFKKDLEPYCKDVEYALELFANFKPASEFHPNWGMDRALIILESCGKVVQKD